MIRSAPKQSTLFSLLVFLIIAYGLGIWSAIVVPSSPVYWYLIPLLCLSTAVVISVKVLWGYRIVTITGDQWRVKKLLGGPVTFSGKSIDWWKETEIKTANGVFKEQHIHTEQTAN